MCADLTIIFSTDSKWWGLTSSLLAQKASNGGTRCRNVGLYFSSVLMNWFDSNFGIVITCPPACSVGSEVTKSPNTWNIGKTHIILGWNVSVAIFMKFSSFPYTFWQIFETRFLVVSITPFGKPVVPEEYGNRATLSQVFSWKRYSWISTLLVLFSKSSYESMLTF